MPRTRRRSTRGRRSVFTPGRQRYSHRFSALASRPSSLGPDVASALAPQVETMAPEGPIFDELPPVDVDPGPSGFGGPDESSPLIDAIMQDEQPLPAATGGPFGGPSGSPESDAALMQAEQTYGTPGQETPLAAATQASGTGIGGDPVSLAPGGQFTDQYALLRAILGF